MKLTDILKKTKEKNIGVEEAAPVIIPLKAGQTYKDLIYEELSGNITAAKREYEKYNKETDRILELLEKQGEFKQNMKDKDRFGNERLTSSLSKRAEELLAPRRIKIKTLKENLERAEAQLSSKTFYLLRLAEQLDDLKFIRYREEAYNLATKKLRELIPFMDKVNSCGFDRDARTGFSINLSGMFNNFVETFESQHPGHFDEEKIKIKFFEEFERVKAEVEKENILKELEDYKKEENKKPVLE